MNPKFTENEIRPEELMEETRRCDRADREKMLAGSAAFVQVACPACDGSRRAPKYEKNGVRYVVCTDCGTMYVNPRSPAAALEKFYAESETYAFWNRAIFPASEAARREKIFRPRVERLLEFCRANGAPAGSLIEIGAGFGTFCEEARSRGAFTRVVAVEPAPDLAATCRSRGLETVELPVEKIGASLGAFDVPASFEVIEHLFAPREFLIACRALLKPRGLLVVTCPSFAGFDIQTLGTLCEGVDHEHLNYFTPDSLARLFESCGFEVLETATPGRLDAEIVRKAVLEGKLDLSGQPFLKKVLIDEWDRLGGPFQEYLAANKLSSHLWVFARKR